MRKAGAIIAFLFFVLTQASVPVRSQCRWQLGKPQSIASFNDTVSIFVIGDVMMHQAQLDKDYSIFLKHIAPRMKKADICIANMEFSLGGKPYTGYPSFSAPENYPEVVAECGTDIFLTANNHILDRGQSGLARTIDIYRSMKDSVLFTGSGASYESFKEINPLIYNKNGIKFAFVNFTYGTNGNKAEGWPNVSYMQKDSVALCFDRARKAGADFIIALPHWGEEYKLEHSSIQQDWAEWMVEQGADVIVGSHPHVVQDTAHIAGVPVIFSVGNAVSNMSAVNTRLEMAVTLRFVRDWLSGGKWMLEPEIRFMWCTLPGRLTDSYATIFVDEWVGKRHLWQQPSDYDNMMETVRRVVPAILGPEAASKYRILAE